MQTKNQNGFTLIELILFLALSSLFLLIALTGIRGRTAAVQRTDAVRSFASFLESQRSAIYNGVNTSGDGSSESQIVLGRTFVFELGSSDISAYTIIGNRVDFDSDDSVKDWIQAAEPESIGLPTVYTLEWGTTIEDAFNIDDDDKIEMFSLLRNPNGQGLVALAYTTDGNPPRPGSGSNESDLYRQDESWSQDAASIHICLESAEGAISEIAVGSGRRDIGIGALFDDNLERCDD